MRYEVTLEISSVGWMIWDNEKKQYIANYGDDEQGARAWAAELNGQGPKEEK